MGVVIRVNNHGTQEIPNGSVTHWNADLLGRTGEDVATPGEGNVQIRVREVQGHHEILGLNDTSELRDVHQPELGGNKGNFLFPTTHGRRGSGD